MIENKKIKWLIIYSSSIGVATLSTAWFAQPFFKEVEIPLVYFGILWAGLNITAGFTSINSHLFDKKEKNIKTLIIISLSTFVLFTALGLVMTTIGIIFITGIYCIRGIATPILRNAINQNTTSNKRATVLSIRSFIIRISFAISAPILGYIADSYSLSISFYILAIIVGTFSLLSAYKLRSLD